MNRDRFLAGERPTSKAFAFQRQRVVFQRNTGVDDARRIHAALLKQGSFAADSLNFLTVTSEEVSTGFLLGMLNSSLAEWRFRLSSTNNHVNAYEIERLPMPKMVVATDSFERDKAVEKVIAMYESDNYSAVVRWTNERLGWAAQAGLPDVSANESVYIFLSHLAERITSSVGKSTEIEQRWNEWVETAVPKADKLTKTFRNRGWVDVGLRDGWDGVKAVFQAKGAVPPSGTLQDLRRETEDALSKLKPLYERIEATDRLIDQIVYRLYGLTEEEIAVVEESVKGA